MVTLDLATNLRDLFKNTKKHSSLPKLYSETGSIVDSLERCYFVEVLDSLIYPKTIHTPFKSKRGSGENYTLESIVNCHSTSSLSYTEYMQECRRLNCPAVSLVDRKDLIAYLSGEKATCDFLDASFVPPVPFRSMEEALKRVKGNATEESVNGKISQFEKIARMELSKNSVASLLDKIERKVLRKPGISKKSYSFVLGIVKEVSKKESSANIPSAVKSSLKTGTKSSMLDSIKANAESSRASHISSQPVLASPSHAPIVSPIIIVPSSFSSLINMHNARKFFEEESFISPQEGRAQGPVRKEIRLKINRKGSNQVYYIIDNVNRLKIEDWANVVAVFVQGESWQFKGWKWESPVELFSQVKGFWLKYEDEDRHCEASNWNVEILNISKSRRHLDSAAVNQFWSTLDAFMEKKRKRV